MLGIFPWQNDHIDFILGYIMRIYILVDLSVGFEFIFGLSIHVFVKILLLRARVLLSTDEKLELLKAYIFTLQMNFI